MNRALLELHLRSLRGRIIRRLRLLRQPRYLLGLAAGLAWIALWAGRPLLRVLSRMRESGGGDVAFEDSGVRIGDTSFSFGPGALMARIPAEAADGVYLLAAAALTFAICLWWILPWHRPVLRLKEEELSLLLSAPLTRRQLIQYAMLRNQPGILVGTLILTLFMGSGGLQRRAIIMFSTWIFLTLWDLHATARHLWHARTHQRRLMSSLRRRLALTTIMATYLLVVSGLVFQAHRQGLAALGGEDRLQAIGSYLAAAGDMPLARILLAPAYAVLAPLFAGAGLTAYLLALALPLILILIHHEWVVRTPSLFEDAALEAARQRGRRKGSTRSRSQWLRGGRRRQPFTLGSSGLPELAITWKNLIQVTRMPLRTLALLGVGAVAVLAIVPLFFALAPRIYLLMGIGGAGMMLLQPLLCGVTQRHDLRVDILHADILRTWPISGARLVAAEIAAPVITTTLTAGFCGLVALAGEVGARLHGRMTTGEASAGLVPQAWWDAADISLLPAIPLLALTLIPLLISLAIVSSAVQNLGVLLFPGWITLGRRRQSGAAQFGQNLLVMVVQMLALLVGLIPGLLLAGALVGLHIFLAVPMPAWEWPLLGLLMALPMAAEAVAVILLTGRQWDRFDPSAQALAET